MFFIPGELSNTIYLIEWHVDINLWFSTATFPPCDIWIIGSSSNLTCLNLKYHVISIKLRMKWTFSPLNTWKIVRLWLRGHYNIDFYINGNFFSIFFLFKARIGWAQFGPQIQHKHLSWEKYRETVFIWLEANTRVQGILFVFLSFQTTWRGIHELPTNLYRNIFAMLRFEAMT